MNMQEFAALKAGDKIENLMSGSKGAIASVDASGVRVTWSNSGQIAQHPGAGPTWHYSVNSTAWMHWSYPPRDCHAGPCYREDCRHADQCLGAGATGNLAV